MQASHSICTRNSAQMCPLIAATAAPAATQSLATHVGVFCSVQIGSAVSLPRPHRVCAAPALGLACTSEPTRRHPICTRSSAQLYTKPSVRAAQTQCGRGSETAEPLCTLQSTPTCVVSDWAATGAAVERRGDAQASLRDAPRNVHEPHTVRHPGQERIVGSSTMHTHIWR